MAYILFASLVGLGLKPLGKGHVGHVPKEAAATNHFAIAMTFRHER